MSVCHSALNDTTAPTPVDETVSCSVQRVAVTKTHSVCQLRGDDANQKGVINPICLCLVPPTMSETTSAESVVRPAIKLVIGLASLLVVRGLVGILPGNGRELPDIGLELGTVIELLLTLVLLGMLGYLGNRLRVRVQDLSYGSPETRQDLSWIVFLVIVLIGVLVAYGGLVPVLVVFVGSTALVFIDAIFLLIGLGVLLGIGYFLLEYVDPLVDALVSYVRGDASGSTSGNTTAPDNGNITCPNC